MTTWGELGNWLSGRTLANTLNRSLGDVKITQIKAESVFPKFAEIGSQISNLSKTANNPEERFQRYSDLLNKEADYFDDIDNDLLCEFNKVISNVKPDIIIGTKGVICRVVIKALALENSKIPVLNYVTNHGHFQFKIHQCYDVDRHIVRFEDSKQYLIENTKFSPEKIIPIGYLLNTYEGAEKTVKKVKSQTLLEKEISIIILSNRGGNQYLQIFEHIISKFPSTEIVFVTLNNKEQFDSATNMVSFHNNKKAKVRKELDHKEFLTLLSSWKKKGPTYFISKASPNAVFEAVYINLPLMLLRSGLPMEDWAVETIKDNELGVVYDSANELIENFDQYMHHPVKAQRIIEDQIIFKQDYLNQKLAYKKLKELILEVHTN